MITIENYNEIKISDLAGFKAIDRHSEMSELSEIYKDCPDIMQDEIIKQEVNFYLKELNEFLATNQPKKLVRTDYLATLTPEILLVANDIILQRTGKIVISNVSLMEKHNIWRKDFYYLLRKLKENGIIEYVYKPNNVGRPKK